MKKTLILIILALLLALSANAETINSEFGFTYKINKDNWFSLTKSSLDEMISKNKYDLSRSKVLSDKVVEIIRAGKAEILLYTPDIKDRAPFVRNINIVEGGLNYSKFIKLTVSDLESLFSSFYRTQIKVYKKDVFDLHGKSAMLLVYGDPNLGNYFNTLYISLSDKKTVMLTYRQREKLETEGSLFKSIVDTISFAKK